jgi:transcriptional regulator NrdR family protein|tara:strand:+ start:538 stop:771 length:234 start_codon:yes stop_codon:yes gene_type:complete
MSICPNCRSLNTKNLETRFRSGKPNPINKNKANIPYTSRRRECIDCGKRYTTREYNIVDLIAFAKLPELQRIDDLMP